LGQLFASLVPALASLETHPVPAATDSILALPLADREILSGWRLRLRIGSLLI
jgi:hypothetical protein